ncbi:MAG: hypothetical protein V3V32_04505 [Dehalococcoidia bacterium]
MADELKHASVGGGLSQAEWEAVATHIADGQTAQDMFAFLGGFWVRTPAVQTDGTHFYTTGRIYPGSGAAVQAVRYFLDDGTDLNIVASGLLFATDAKAIMAPDADNDYLMLQARNNGVGLVEVARLEGDAEPRLCHTAPVNLLGAAISQLEITVGGAITITAGVHTVETNGGGATDDLDDINGGRTGDILVIVPADATHSVVAKHGTGNLNLAAGIDFTMDEDDDFLILLLVGAVWQEISRSENHA